MRYNVCNCVKSALLVACLLFQSQTEATRPAKPDYLYFGKVRFKVVNKDEEGAIKVNVNNDTLFPSLKEIYIRVDSTDVCVQNAMSPSRKEELTRSDSPDVWEEFVEFMKEPLARADSSDVCVQNAMSTSRIEELTRSDSPDVWEEFVEFMKEPL